jgi:hypothetical protein
MEVSALNSIEPRLTSPASWSSSLTRPLRSFMTGLYVACKRLAIPALVAITRFSAPLAGSVRSRSFVLPCSVSQTTCASACSTSTGC